MALGRFLDPKNDLAFNRIFGTEKNKDILIHFLNDIFSLSKNPIKTVKFLKTVQIPEIQVQRSSLVDVLCEDQNGDRFIIEMQVDGEPGFEKRAQYYAAKAYVEQRNLNNDYHNLKKVTFLAITSHTLFKDKKAYLSHHQMRDIETLEHDLVEFSFSFLELPKFKKKKNELTNLIEKWASFLKNARRTEEEDLAGIIGEDLIIRRAYDEISQYAWTPEELRYYDSIDMKHSANEAVMQGAWDGGKAEGKVEGKAEGKVEGEAIGIEKTARKLLELGIDRAS